MERTLDFEKIFQAVFLISVPRLPWSSLLPMLRACFIWVIPLMKRVIQDILVRRSRMKGYNACWVPGSDHASIATEARVVAMLKEKGNRQEHPFQNRRLFLNMHLNGRRNTEISSMVRLHAWAAVWTGTGQTFTMDDHYYKAVIKGFR